MKRNNYVVANWKMNGLRSFIKIFNAINKHLISKKLNNTNVIVCPPYTLINTLVSSKKSKVMIGAQDTHELDSGAYTGCVSSEMINDLGAKYVIIGHSERRQLFGEDVELLSKKILSAHKHGLKVIFCIGELESEIKNRKSILRKQLKSLPKKLDHKKLIIAYEPVWAIGTGLTPTLDEINQVHELIKNFDQKFINFKVLYGGSVKSSNSKEINELIHVDGCLIGGASLNVDEFNTIIS